MLAHAGADDGVLVRRLAVEFLNHGLRSDVALAVFIGEGVLFLPAFDRLEPFRRTGEAGGFAFPPLPCQGRVENAEGVLHVGADGMGDFFVFVNLGRVNVNVDDSGVRTEHADGSRHTVVKACGQGDDQVRFIHGIVGKHGSVHAQPSEGERVSFRHGPDAHQGGCHGNLGAFREFQQVRGGFRGDDARRRHR